jgi:hypothetical protein
LKDAEYNFLWSVAQYLKVVPDIFEGLFDNETEHMRLKAQAERILQFHRLVLLMNIDQVQEEIEIRRLHDMGLGMG